jgi:hypothetical protein
MRVTYTYSYKNKRCQTEHDSANDALDTAIADIRHHAARPISIANANGIVLYDADDIRSIATTPPDPVVDKVRKQARSQRPGMWTRIKQILWGNPGSWQ